MTTEHKQAERVMARAADMRDRARKLARVATTMARLADKQYWNNKDSQRWRECERIVVENI